MTGLSIHRGALSTLFSRAGYIVLICCALLMTIACESNLDTLTAPSATKLISDAPDEDEGLSLQYHARTLTLSQDLDIDFGEYALSVGFSRAEDEALGQEYLLYWGRGKTQKASQNAIATFTASTNDYSYEIEPNTLAPFGASSILLFTRVAGEEFLSDSKELADLSYSNSGDALIVFSADIDPDPGECSIALDFSGIMPYSPQGTILAFWGQDAETILTTSFEALFSYDLANGGDSVEITADTAIPSGASYILLYLSNAQSGSLHLIHAYKLKDNTYSLERAKKLALSDDRNVNSGLFSAELSLQRADDETNIESYAVYWGSSSSTILSSQQTVWNTLANGSDHNYTLPSNTKLPAKATHLLLYTNYTGNTLPSLSDAVAIGDVGLNLELASSLDLGLDRDCDMGEYSTTIHFQTNAHAQSVTSYSLYWGDASSAIVTGSDSHIATVQHPDLAASGTSVTITHTLGADIAIPDGASTFVLTTNFDDYGVTINSASREFRDLVVERVSDINSSGSSDVSDLIKFRGKLYFSANDGRSVYGHELWRYNNGSGLSLAADIAPGTDSSYVQDIVLYGNDLYFSAYTAANGTELYSFNGQKAIMHEILEDTSSSYPSHLTLFDDKLFFAAYGELELAATLSSSEANSMVETSALVPVLSVYVPATVEQLFSYDEKTDSFEKFEITGEGSYPNPQNFCVYDGHLYFQAELSQTSGSYNRVLFRCDGASLEQLDIAGLVDPDPSELTVWNNTLYLAVWDKDTFGRELWIFDGNAFSMLTDLAVGSEGSNPRGLFAFNDRLYFSADDGSGMNDELWSLGLGGDFSVIELNTESGQGSFPQLEYAEYEGYMFFRAEGNLGHGEDHGFELWCYDGNSSPIEVLDINPGSADAAISELTEYNGKLFFVADDGVYGKELWRLYFADLDED